MHLERTASVSMRGAPSQAMPRTPVKSCPPSLGGCAASSGSSSQPSMGGSPPCSSTLPSFGTFLVYTLGLIACILLFIHTWSERHQRAANNISWSAVPSSSWRGSSLSKSRQMEMLLLTKDDEIQRLRNEHSQIVHGSELADANVQAQEAIVYKLRQRVEAERIAREKAHFAFGERAQALDQCQLQQRSLEREVVACGKDLDDLKGMGMDSSTRGEM